MKRALFAGAALFIAAVVSTTAFERGFNHDLSAVAHSAKVEGA